MNCFVTTVVVTYNRKLLLRTCLYALLKQSRLPDRILIVDNASTDGTRDLLESEGWLARDKVELLTLPENLGGSGGFAAGIRHAMNAGTDLAWIMDDDAIPDPPALESLLQCVEPNTNKLYGSVAVHGSDLAWPLRVADSRRSVSLTAPEQLPRRMNVEFIPFLGLLVSKEIVEQIGLPDAGFFIAKDDVEYCLRAQQAGIASAICSNSKIEHPPAQYHRLRIGAFEFKTLDLPAWKRYYSVRNRIFIARRYFGFALYYATLPGSLLHLLLALAFENDRAKQLKAYLAGTLDGLRGRSGRRHGLWRL